MLNKRVEEAVNNQINAELYSAYLYLSMAAYFENQNLPGFASWMRVQFQEEQAHAFGFFNYIYSRGGKVTLKPIDGPKVEFDGVVEIFEETLKHELYVTSLIHGLVDIAIEEKDYASSRFFQWYVNEQVEEEANAEKILADLKMIGGKGEGILMLDRELGARVFVQPVIG